MYIAVNLLTTNIKLFAIKINDLKMFSVKISKKAKPNMWKIRSALQTRRYIIK